MNLRDLEYLIALAEHRHFGRAAAAVYVSQPTLSTQIRKLEDELGATLIERGHRSVLLTALGQDVVERARQILQGADEIRALAQRASSPHTGSLRLGAFPTLAPYLLPHIMPKLTTALPDLEILLVEAKTADLLDQLHDGRLDAAFIALPINSDDLHIDPLFREEFVLACPAGHPIASLPEPLHISSLSGKDLLLLSDGHCLRDQALEVCALAGVRERRGYQATSLETLRLMVAAGVGMTLLPRLAISAPVPPHDGIALRSFAEQPAPHRDIVLLSRDSYVQRNLLNHVVQQVRLALVKLPVEVAED